MKKKNEKICFFSKLEVNFNPPTFKIINFQSLTIYEI
jgi:hypothetical protein